MTKFERWVFGFANPEQYTTDAPFEVALQYCSNDHKMITTSITADEKLIFLLQGIWSRERSSGSAQFGSC